MTDATTQAYDQALNEANSKLQKRLQEIDAEQEAAINLAEVKRDAAWAEHTAALNAADEALRAAKKSTRHRTK